MDYTPGPWRISEPSPSPTSLRPWSVESEKGEPIAEMTLRHSDEANARLIAKAPSMYEVLKALVQPRNECYPRSKRSMKAALALIDEIEGPQ